MAERRCLLRRTTRRPLFRPPALGRIDKLRVERIIDGRRFASLQPPPRQLITANIRTIIRAGLCFSLTCYCELSSAQTLPPAVVAWLPLVGSWERASLVVTGELKDVRLLAERPASSVPFPV